MALHWIISHHITPLHITSHHNTSHHITSHHITSHHTRSHHIESFNNSLCYVAHHRITLCCNTSLFANKCKHCEHFYTFCRHRAWTRSGRDASGDSRRSRCWVRSRAPPLALRGRHGQVLRRRRRLDQLQPQGRQVRPERLEADQWDPWNSVRSAHLLLKDANSFGRRVINRTFYWLKEGECLKRSKIKDLTMNTAKKLVLIWAA